MSVLYDLEWRLADDTPVGSVDGVTTVDYHDLSGLSACTTYEWRIRSDDAGTKSDWSDWSTFQTALVLPAVVVVAAFPVPVIATGTIVEVPEIAGAVAFPVPSIASGASVAVPEIGVVVEFPSPNIAVAPVIDVPVIAVTVDFPCPCYIGPRLEGVDRPRITSDSPRYRVSHAA
jgi:hypothetical protein